ncbi:tetratricopeptide repeat protein [Sandaracinus amylolyticus]|uniref:tetratricopeptide repeat protein n=1 Tax=Sandaracinus amylolyticus TaxID=927083 RepID=UPI001F427FE2|nr:tetratricopeptide repeat protein [Sandaracinus amylolyticus]UJR79654.1 Hypothetical protein I5071_16920 [Sandaracinus amylolyticus]
MRRPAFATGRSAAPWVVIAIGIATLAITPRAWAQDEDPERVAMARALFQEGVELARRESYEDATDRFRRAYAIRPAPAIAFNLASALMHRGLLVEASEALQRVLRDPSTTAELRSSAEAQRADIARRLGRLTVRLDGDPTDVRVRVGTRELPAEAVGVAVPFDPGSHDAVATRDGEDVARAHVDVAEGGSAEVVLAVPPRAERAEAPVAALQVTPAESAPPSDRGGGDDTWLWVGIIGGAAVAIGVGVALAVVFTTPSGEEAPSIGNAMPGVIEW